MTRTNCPSEFPHTIRRHKVDEDGNEVYEDILNEEEEVVGKKPVYEYDQYPSPHQFPGGLEGATTPFVRAIWFGFTPAKDFAVNALDLSDPVEIGVDENEEPITEPLNRHVERFVRGHVQRQLGIRLSTSYLSFNGYEKIGRTAGERAIEDLKERWGWEP